MYIKAHLGWLRGMPLAQHEGAIDWSYRPPDASLSARTIRLDRSHLQKAEFAVNKLLHRFPHALPKVVGDVGTRGSTRYWIG